MIYLNTLFINILIRKYRKIQISKIKTRDLNLSTKRPLNSRMNINKIQKYLKVDIKNWKFYLDKYLKGLK